MKTNFKIGNRYQFPAMTGALAFSILLPGALSVAAQTTNTTPTSATPPAKAATTDDFEVSPTDFNNWVTFGVGETTLSGDKAQFEHQQDTKAGVYGGVQDFHWQEFAGKSGLLTVDGHGMFANHDYAVKLELQDPNKGYISAGYTEFRTWYSDNGGYYPLDHQSFQPDDTELHIDRGSAWVEGGLTLPDKPSLTLRYEHDFRQGMKDSTSWGDDDTSTTPPDRKIAPTFLNIDETRDIVQAKVKDKIGDTDAGVTLRYEIDRNNDSTLINLDPGTPTANRYVTQNVPEVNDIFNANGYTETFFNKRVTFTLGGSFTTIDTYLSGSRIYGASYNAPFSPTYPHQQARDAGFTDLSGGGNMKEYVGNMNFMLTPLDYLVLVPAFRMEYDGDDLSDNFNSTSIPNTTAPATVTPTTGGSDNWYLDVAESLEARYTGLRNWSFYASGEWNQDSGNDIWNQEPTAGVYTPVMNQDWNMIGQKYTVGANWYPFSRLNFGSQYYHEDHDYDYGYNLAANLTGYPGFLTHQEFTTDDMNIRGTWRILDNLSSVTRYDFQLETVDTCGGLSPTAPGNPLSTVESCNITSHIISENVMWTPLPRLYLQGGGSYVLNTVDTPIASGTGALLGVVQNGENNYWTANASLGYAIDQKTDLQLQYNYYQANNFSDNSAVGMPYGAGEKQHSVTATITRQITKAIKVGLKYGFYTNRDETSGGLNNYTAQLVYANMEYRF